MFSTLAFLKNNIYFYLKSNFEIGGTAQESIQSALHEDTVFTLEDINKILSSHNTKEVGEALSELGYDRYSATMDAYAEIDKAVAEYRNFKNSEPLTTHRNSDKLLAEILGVEVAQKPKFVHSDIGNNGVDSGNKTNIGAYHPVTGEFIENMTFGQYEEIMGKPFQKPNSTIQGNFPTLNSGSIGNINVGGKSEKVDNGKYDVNSWGKWSQEGSMSLPKENADITNVSKQEFQSIIQKYGDTLTDNNFIRTISDSKIHAVIIQNALRQLEKSGISRFFLEI